MDGDDGTFVLQEVSLDEDDSNMQFEIVPEGSDEDEADVDFFSSNDPNSIKELLAETQNLRQKRPQEEKESTPAVAPKPKATASVRERPIVAEDFIRNFLIKLKLTQTLDAFNTEWYEKKATGKLNPEDVEAVPDLYLKNAELDAQVKRLREEVVTAQQLASKAKGTWDKFRKERDFHRMHHRRVVQEKNTLIRDMKRLKTHYGQFEPAMEAMKHKYEEAMKEKMLIRLEKERIQNKLSEVQDQVEQFESLAETAANRGLGKTSSSTRATTRNQEEFKSVKAATVAGGGASMLLPKKGDSQLPSDKRANPYIGRKYTEAKAAEWSVRRTVEAHKLPVSGMALHPTKPVLATVSDDNTWKMWSVPKGELIMSGDGHRDWVASCEFHPRGAFLGTASGDGTVKLWDFVKARCAATFVDHSQAVWDLAFHDAGDFLVSASMDRTVKMWDVNSGRCRQTIRGHVDSVNSVVFQPYTNNICTGSGDKTVSLWDLRSGRCAQTFYGHNNSVNSVCFNLTGDKVVSGDANGVVKVWDIRSLSEAAHIVTAEGKTDVAANDVKFDASGNTLAVASESGDIKIYGLDEDSPKFLGDLKGHSGPVQCLLFPGASATADPSLAVNQNFLLSGGSDQTFRLWS